jgi:tetratricopeptide (TPR) repeat protein
MGTLISIGCLLAAVAAAQGVGQGIGQGAGTGVAPVPPVAPVPAPAAPQPAKDPLKAQEKAQEKMVEAQEKIARTRANMAQVTTSLGAMSGELAYERGQTALDRHRWDEALADFTQAASQAGSRADGALYWKAYTLNKLGRREEAVAAIAELRKSYASSRWLGDASALEIEVKQSSGQPVSPDAQTDEDLKLMALNGLMQSDPDRALTALDGLLKSAQSPRLKEQALFVLAQNSSPRAQRMLEQVARGSANPDLQLKAISFLGPRTTIEKEGRLVHQSPSNHGQILFEIYESSSDVNVKRAALNAFSASGDTDRLLQIAKTEKDAELRRDAVRRLTSLKNPAATDALVAMYGTEQDKEVRRAIVTSLASQNDVKQLVAVARTEKDPETVRYIVSRLAGMKSPEAADYLMEILKK